MRIGIDLDNTIIDYDRAFADAAVALGILSAAAGGKTAVRDRIRALPDGETQWQRLQAHVYGPGIAAAALYPGVAAFLETAAARGIATTIVSHKSPFAAAAPDGPNLRACAAAFLRDRGIAVPVHFEESRGEKCARIAALGCTHFVDDLVEVFADPAFPRNVARWLFAPHGAASDPPADRIFFSWNALTAALP